jgi:murein DD-endopeptidase MepM/ murein hydrolase activator NlpD
MRLAVALSLLLVAAALPQHGDGPERAGPQNAPLSDPAHHDSIAPSYWFAILPAPATPAGWQPPQQGSRLLWPVRAPISQPFGCTNFDLEGRTASCPGGFHTGLDLAAPGGTPVHAAADGIAYPLPDYEIYGNHVLVASAGGIGTVYAHLSAFDVAWGQQVRQGDVIGYVGSTGNSTGPHLHFEVRFAGAPLDPLPYLEGSPADPGPVPAGWPGYPADDDPFGFG